MFSLPCDEAPNEQIVLQNILAVLTNAAFTCEVLVQQHRAVVSKSLQL